MEKTAKYRRLGLLGIVLGLLAAIAMACASAEPTPIPVAPSQPAAPQAPAAAPQPTVALVPGAPTPIPAKATPTRVLPTPTSVAMAGGPRYGGILRMAAALDNKTMDPQADTRTWGRPVTYGLFNGIVKYDAKFNVVPDIARSWEFSSDGKTVTFHLAKGAKFHDGTPVDADAVKFSLERVMNPEAGIPYRGSLEPFIERVEVVDELTLAIHLGSPFRPLLATLGDRAGFVVPKSAPIPAEGFGETGFSDFARKGTGSGPFKLKEWTIGSRIVLEKWDDYWEEGKPYLDGIIYQEVSEYASQFAMIRTGETDLMEVRPQDLGIARSNANIKIVAHESGRWHAISFTSDVPPWNNRNLRRALAFSIDRETFIDVHYGGIGRPAYALENFAWTANDDIKPISYDTEKAKQELTLAGFPNGVDIDFWCVSDSVSLQFCELTQTMAGEVGINLNIIPLPRREFTPNMLNKTSNNRAPTSWRPRADPDGRLRLLIHCEGGRVAQYGYCNPEVDKLLDEAVGVYDTAKAKLLYDQAQLILAEDVPFALITYSTNFAALSNNVQGFEWVPDFQWRLRDLWFSQ